MQETVTVDTFKDIQRKLCFSKQPFVVQGESNSSQTSRWGHLQILLCSEQNWTFYTINTQWNFAQLELEDGRWKTRGMKAVHGRSLPQNIPRSFRCRGGVWSDIDNKSLINLYSSSTQSFPSFLRAPSSSANSPESTIRRRGRAAYCQSGRLSMHWRADERQTGACIWIQPMWRHLEN